MNGLEAIELMKQGKVVVRVDARVQYRLNNDRVEGADHIGRWSDGWMFSVNSEYEEYIEPKPLTGWDRTEHWEDAEGFYSIAECDVLADRTSYNHVLNQKCYENANYFSTKEKAEEINFKQTLFRRLQRFSDENGGDKVDWNKLSQDKWMIRFDHRFKELYVSHSSYFKNFGQVYFISEEIAKQAVELFHDELIKYFTM